MAKKKLSTAEMLAAARAEIKEDGAATPDAAPAKSPQPPAGGAPKSTADILAAARAGKTENAQVEKPAMAASPKKPAASASGDRPSVQEMLQAVRSGKRTSETTAQDVVAPEKPQRPVRPSRPVPPVKGGKKKEPDAGRRSLLLSLLLSPFALAWIMFGGAATAFTLAVARFMMPNVLVEPPSKFKIGPASDYPAGTVSTKWKAQFGVWIVNTDWAGHGELVALSTVCTHLGCTPNWLESEQKFKCPCHGSGFYVTGVNFEGPAPRPLERHGIRVASDGMVEVDKSVKYQEELGQWSDNSSYVKIS